MPRVYASLVAMSRCSSLPVWTVTSTPLPPSPAYSCSSLFSHHLLNLSHTKLGAITLHTISSRGNPFAAISFVLNFTAFGRFSSRSNGASLSRPILDQSLPPRPDESIYPDAISSNGCQFIKEKDRTFFWVSTEQPKTRLFPNHTLPQFRGSRHGFGDAKIRAPNLAPQSVRSALSPMCYGCGRAY